MDIPEIQSETGASQQELTSCKDQLMRISADFANFKKRVEKERLEWVQAGQTAILKGILPVLIDFDRAIQSTALVTPGDGAAKPEAVDLEGFKLIQKNMQKTLADLGVQSVETTNGFDPHFHEALMQVDSPDHQSGQIAQVFSPGYTFKGEVILHAKVSVAK